MTEQINLKNVTEHQAQQLFKFFNPKKAWLLKKGLEWEKNESYIFEDGSTFSFKHSVFARKGKNGMRYEVISNKPALGHGGYGSVHLIKGTVSFDENNAYHFEKLRPVKDKSTGKVTEKVKGRQVVKVQAHGNDSSIVRLNNEYSMSQRAGHLAIKRPSVVVYDEDRPWRSYTVMNKFSGTTLFNIIKNDATKKAVLTASQRLELTLALLKALKVQVKDKGILHRDIKPDNIIVEDSNVNIIDFGLSLLAENSHRQQAGFGTLGYFAPEVAYHPARVSYKADVFSLGIVIAAIWRTPAVNLGQDLQRAMCNYYTLLKSPELLIEGIFKGIEDLTLVEQQQIRAAILGMLCYEPRLRFSIEEAIKEFAAIELQKTPVEDSVKEVTGQYAKVNLQCSFFSPSPDDCKRSAAEKQKTGPAPSQEPPSKLEK